jgi:type IV secretion system protein VirB5
MAFNLVKNLKRAVLGLCFGLGLLGSGSNAFAQGIPVYDNAQVLQAIQQLLQLQQQYQQMQQEYSSLTGVRGFGDLLNNPALRSYLPQNWQTVYDSIKTGGFNSLTSDAQAIRNGIAIYNCDGRTGASLQVCQQQAYKPAQDKAYMQESYTTALSRVNDMQSLINQISATNDPKGIAELQARLQGEQVAVQNEKVKLDLFKMLSDADDKLTQQQLREQVLQQTSLRGHTASSLSPVSFQ